MTIETKELAPELWPALEHFFLAEKCSGCWCMNHRLTSRETLEGEPAKAALAERVRLRRISGILAFDQNLPVGWCAFDRMADLPGLDCARPVPEAQRNDVWSIHCLSVLSSHPRDAVVERMLDAALRVMKREGARLVEGYPPPRLPSDNSFSGTVQNFERQGFRLEEKVSKFYARMVKTIVR